MTPAEFGAASAQHQAAWERLEDRIDFWGAHLKAVTINAPWCKPKQAAQPADFLPKQQKPNVAKEAKKPGRPPMTVSEQMRFWGKMEAEIAKAEKRKREQRGRHPSGLSRRRT